MYVGWGGVALLGVVSLLLDVGVSRFIVQEASVSIYKGRFAQVASGFCIRVGRPLCDGGDPSLGRPAVLRGEVRRDDANGDVLLSFRSRSVADRLRANSPYAASELDSICFDSALRVRFEKDTTARRSERGVALCHCQQSFGVSVWATLGFRPVCFKHSWGLSLRDILDLPRVYSVHLLRSR